MNFQIVKANRPFVTFSDKVNHGSFTVSAPRPNSSWRNFLHSDGIVRDSPMNENGEFTGWYMTRDDAAKALKKILVK